MQKSLAVISYFVFIFALISLSSIYNLEFKDTITYAFLFIFLSIGFDILMKNKEEKTDSQYIEGIGFLIIFLSIILVFLRLTV